MQIKELVQRGNIHTTHCRKDLRGRYLGNGRFGTVLSGFGLNAQPRRQNENPLEGRSLFSHMSHWGRFRFVSDATGGETAADYILPLIRVYWEEEPERVRQYDQYQDFHKGTVRTEFTDEFGQHVQVTGWTDMEKKDISCFEVFLSGGERVIRVDAVTEFIPYAFLYKKKTAQSVQVEPVEGGWKLIVWCRDTVNQRRSEVFLYTNAAVESFSEGLRITAKAGQTNILISYGSPAQKDKTAISLIRTEKCWQQLWERTGWLSFPDDRVQQMWVRSMAYLLASYADFDYGIQPTSGLSGNMFPFHFVQDMAYIAPALMMLGHVEIVRRWLEKFAGDIPDMRAYAKHLWPEAEGIYPPWELPYGSIQGYHSPCVPVIYCYEPHNVGYLCRMAAETAEYLNDPDWTQRIAAPLIRECAAFYRAFANKGSDGYWHLKWYPCVGQDEAGGRNKSDYLCSLYSAKYCFTAMCRFGLDETGEYSGILEDGLCFESLLSPRGTLHTTRGADDYGRQKHPVQLDGVTYMPTEQEAFPPERLAYSLRHDITEGAKIPHYEGWTLGQFLLAGTNLGDVSGWKQDWDQMRPADYTDPDWVQIYETSGQTEKSFYMATHGLVLQSLIRNYVNDYWNRIDVAACPVFADGVAFGNIRSRLGAVVSGKVENGLCSYEITAQKNGALYIGDTKCNLTEGETFRGTHRLARK